MHFARLVETSATVSATRSRKAKTAALADLFGSLDPDEIVPAVAFLAGEARQGRIGVGWSTVADVDVVAAIEPTLTIGAVDRAIDELAGISGPGSAAGRRAVLQELVGSATDAEADFLRRLLVGGLRQGALEGIVVEGVAKAAGVPARSVRRALMLSGDLGATAETALLDGDKGLAAVRLEVLRAVYPMLASTAVGVGEALAAMAGRQAAVDWKLDGARIQVHRRDDEIRVFTRNLNDVTARLPTVVEVVGGFDVDEVVLDGEAMGFTSDRVPQAFQDLISRFARDDDPEAGAALAPFFFDILHLDGAALIDEPLSTRLDALDGVVGDSRVPRVVTDNEEVAADALEQALAAGHEGVVVKSLDSTYEAGRRGKAWRKVKPVHTLDLVVLAVEWGSGRRQGWLSNIHMGARNPDGGFVMVGKTFKGMTDEMLDWQTARFLELESERRGHVVHVRPEQVVEVALDGVQVSSRYPGGVALRFARVRGYREDKQAHDADTIDQVRALLPPAYRDQA